MPAGKRDAPMELRVSTIRAGASGARPVAGASAGRPKPVRWPGRGGGIDREAPADIASRRVGGDRVGALGKDGAGHDDDCVVALKDLLGDTAGVLAERTQTSMRCPSGPVEACRSASGSFWHHRDDRKAGGAGPPAERHRAGRLDDEAVEVGRRAVAGEQDRVGGAWVIAEATKHVERCAAVPLWRGCQVALAEAGRAGGSGAGCRLRGRGRSSTVRCGCVRWC